MAIANIVKSTLGPIGLDKMLVRGGLEGGLEGVVCVQGARTCHTTHTQPCCPLPFMLSPPSRLAS